MKIHSLLLLLLLYSCSNVQNTSTKVPDDWKRYSKKNYTISYPKEWNLKEDAMGTDLVLMSPLTSKLDLFSENINVMIQDLSNEKLDLDQFVSLSENQIKTNFVNAQLLKSERLQRNDEEYHHFIYTGDQGVYHLQFEQYCWVINKQSYILTFTSEQSEYKNTAKTALQIMNSFQFIQ